MKAEKCVPQEEAGKSRELKRGKRLLYFLNNLFLLVSVVLAALLARRSAVIGRNGEKIFYTAGALIGGLLFVLRLLLFRPDKKKFVRRLTMIAAASLSWLFVVLPLLTAVISYEKVFGKRFDSLPAYERDVSEFPGMALRMERFPSDKGQELQAYISSPENSAAEAVVVMVHGLGGGHKHSLGQAYYFTQQGFAVLGFDISGNERSEGKALGGFPQALLDLKAALRFLKEDPILQDLPILLFGHSMGAYAADVVLAEPEGEDIRAVVSLAAPDSSLMAIQASGEEMAGKGIEYLLPHFSLYERCKFGKIAERTASEGLDAAEGTDVRIVQAEDDKIVPLWGGYELYYAKHQQDEHIRFLLLPEGGHNKILYSENALKEQKIFNDHIKAYMKTLPGGRLTRELKQAYMEKYFDKAKQYEVNEELFRQISDFYKASLQ